jgi:hypothetical protein
VQNAFFIGLFALLGQLSYGAQRETTSRSHGAKAGLMYIPSILSGVQTFGLCNN